MAARFSWVNAIDTAILTAGDQTSSLPVANLVDRRVQKVWRSGVSTSTWFGADFRNSVPVTIVGLFGMTLAAADTVRVRLSNTAPGGGELWDSGTVACGVVPGFDQWVHILDGAITARYIRVDIAAASRAGIGSFDIGRAWAGDAFEPSVNFSLGWKERWLDSSVVEKSLRSGARFVDAGAVRRSLDVTFDWLSESDRQQVLEMDRVIGRRGQMLFIPDDEGDLARGALLGGMADTAAVSQPGDFASPVYSRPFTIEQDM